MAQSDLIAEVVRLEQELKSLKTTQVYNITQSEWYESNELEIQERIWDWDGVSYRGVVGEITFTGVYEGKQAIGYPVIKWNAPASSYYYSNGSFIFTTSEKPNQFKVMILCQDTLLQSEPIKVSVMANMPGTIQYEDKAKEDA